ncbi:MAG: FIST C-terminal domain-containing protein [Spirochaetaceae bacterium]|jgi:hypothetical protein|nr:FIST C-terminal domain-containing protein [Spirochaetaceae bacterium]
MAIKVAGRPHYDMDGVLKEIVQPDVKVVVYFFSVEFERHQPQLAVKRAFPRAVCIGASMYGGWCATGVVDKGIIAMSLGAEEVEETFVAYEEGVKAAPVKCTRTAIESLKQKLGYRNINPDDYLGIVLLDGLCRGEVIMQELSLDPRMNLPFVGGAAGEEMTFVKTLISMDEKISSDGLVLLIMKMRIPFYYNHYVHFTPGTKCIEATRVDAPQRIVWEINGEPAAPFYAKLVNVGRIDQLETSIFARNPLGVVSGNRCYCRSIHGVVDGKGLRFFCYIEAGTTLYLLNGGDIIANSRKALQDAQDHLPAVQGALFFNCVFRHMELKALHKVEEFNGIFKSLDFIGFTCYGEELFTHHNQTLTTIFFGRP